MICAGAMLIDTGDLWRQGTKALRALRRIRHRSRWHLESDAVPGTARCCDAIRLGQEAHRAARPDRACKHCLHRAGLYTIGGRAT